MAGILRARRDSRRAAPAAEVCRHGVYGILMCSALVLLLNAVGAALSYHTAQCGAIGIAFGIRIARPAQSVFKKPMLTEFEKKGSTQSSAMTGALTSTLPTMTVTTIGAMTTTTTSQLVAIYAIAIDGGAKTHAKRDNFLFSLRFGCSAFRQNRTLPVHLTVAGFRPTLVKVLRDTGMHVHDRSAQIDEVKSWWKPVMSAKQAQREGRAWPNYGRAPQRRQDGWCTYFKFFTWLDKRYKYVLQTDTDQYFGRPYVEELLEVIRGFEQTGTDFCGNPESFGSDQHLLTNTMLFRPSETFFHELVERASNGSYMPFTNTEQEVVDANLYGWRGGKTYNVRTNCTNWDNIQLMAHHLPLEYPSNKSCKCTRKELEKEFATRTLTCDIFWERCMVCP